MLTCLVIAGSLWIGDANILYPTQGTYYFHKFQQIVRVYNKDGSRMGSFDIPESIKSDTISEVFKKCSKEKGNE